MNQSADIVITRLVGPHPHPGGRATTGISPARQEAIDTLDAALARVRQILPGQADEEALSMIAVAIAHVSANAWTDQAPA